MMSQLITAQLERNRQIDVKQVRKSEREAQEQVDLNKLREIAEKKLVLLQESLLGAEIRMKFPDSSYKQVVYLIVPSIDLMCNFSEDFVSCTIIKGHLKLTQGTKRTYQSMISSGVAKYNTVDQWDESRVIEMLTEILIYPPLWKTQKQIENQIALTCWSGVIVLLLASCCFVFVSTQTDIRNYPPNIAVSLALVIAFIVSFGLMLLASWAGKSLLYRDWRKVFLEAQKKRR